MSDASGSVWISFNGEIYNYRSLRVDLESKGYRFRSDTDTEVLLYLYMEEGQDFTDLVNGMFAIAIWDERDRSLLLVRDHAGIKPLYYWSDGQRLFFSSEIKSLLEIPEIPRRINYRQIPTYLTLLWVPGSQTMLDGIRKIEPGQRLIWRDGDVHIERWFQIRYEPDDGVAPADWRERVRDTLGQSVERQMVSDVPLGAFLSGGLDSSSIAAAMRRSFPDRDINCYSLQFDPSDLDRDQFEEDLPYARRVASHLGVNLKTISVDASSAEQLPQLIYQMDEPDADPAMIPTYLISKLARSDGTTVLLSGTGGDEVFFGYRSHLAYRLLETLDRVPLSTQALFAASSVASRVNARGALARRLAKLARASAAAGLDRHTALVDWSDDRTRHQILSDQLGAALQGDRSAPLRDIYDRFEGEGELNRHTHVLTESFLASHNFLYTDKMGMAASVEIRVPFTDIELMRLAARIPERIKLPGRRLKGLLKEAMSDYLPAEVVDRPKTGFMLPIRRWLDEELEPLLLDSLDPHTIESQGIFDSDAIAAIIRENKENRADHSYLLYALLTFQLWRSAFVS